MSEHQNADVCYTIFKHQVAGHGAIRKFGNGRIIKPAIPKEVFFYQSLSQNTTLTQFMPQYFGVLKLGNSGESTITVPVPSTNRIAENNRSEKPVKNEYIILEDISSGYKAPSVLDLKMGTRHYGQFADPQKKARAIRKCQQSTSNTLGFRVCGMQVFRPGQQQYLRRDKQYGRLLTDETIASSFLLFLFDGDRLRWELVPLFLSAVTQLLQVIGDMPGYRFYSSSLLMIYDGGDTGPGSASRTDLRVIDFAKAFRETDSEEPDKGFLLGLSKIIHTLQSVQQQQEVPSSIDIGWREEAAMLSMRRGSASEAPPEKSKNENKNLAEDASAEVAFESEEGGKGDLDDSHNLEAPPSPMSLDFDERDEYNFDAQSPKSVHSMPAL